MTAPTGALRMLRANERTAPWLDYLETLGPAMVSYQIPSKQELANRLAWCGVPIEVIPAIVAQASLIAADDDFSWLLDRTVQYLWTGMDHWQWPPQISPLPEALGEPGRWFFAVAFATYLPITLDLHRKRGIAEPISQATMADVGRHVLIHEARHGVPGLADPDWLWLHLRGMNYQLGRLQFERATLGGTTSWALQARGFDYQHREPCLAVHIPSYSGSLDPEACDASFAQARAFYARHYPEEPHRLAVCKSWLMDRQLAQFLPATSNIVRFQQRFGIAYTPEAPDDRDTLEFVFRTPDVPLDQLPQRTTLERGVVRHLQAGGHFHGGMGWIPLA
jgi:hypothetical protein